MKMIVFILGLALISYVVYTSLMKTKAPETVDSQGNVIVQPGQQNPGKQLDNVRGAADRISQQHEDRAKAAEGSGN